MEPLTTKDLALLNASLLKLYSFQDAAEFSSDLVRLLSTLIPADICSYDAIDAQSQQADLKWTPNDVVMIPDGFSILAKHVDDNPIVPHFRKTGDGSAKMVSDFLSQRTFQARPLYEEFYKHYGISRHLIAAIIDQWADNSHPCLSSRGERIFGAGSPHPQLLPSARSSGPSDRSQPLRASPRGSHEPGRPCVSSFAGPLCICKWTHHMDHPLL